MTLSKKLTQYWLFNRGGTMPTIPNNLHKQTLTEFLMEICKENERLKEKIRKFRWDNPYFDLYNNVVNQRNMWEEKSKQYKTYLKEIKEIAESTVKPNILRTDGTAMYGIDKIIKLTEVEDDE